VDALFSFLVAALDGKCRRCACRDPQFEKRNLSPFLRNTESHQPSRGSCPVHEPALPCPSHAYLPVPLRTQETSQAGEPLCCCILPSCARRKLRVSPLFFLLKPFPAFCYDLMLTRFRLLLKAQNSNLSTLACLSYPPRPIRTVMA
jgi:hypothetical protein